MRKGTKDIQAQTDGFHKIPIQKVGVRNLITPFTIKRKSGGQFNTIAKFSSYCDLVESIKGINMSRIARSINEVLNKEGLEGFDCLDTFAHKLADSHNTNHIWVKSEFDYVIEDTSPVTNLASYEPIKVEFETILKDGRHRNYLSINMVAMSLCPCSKEMSLLKNNVSEYVWDLLTSGKDDDTLDKLERAGFGAHNQKSFITIKVEITDSTDWMWIEDLFEIGRRGASCPTYSTLKRPDEKYVTEVSYMGGYYDESSNFVKVENSGPKFVEDISRDIANELNKEMGKRINDYVIVVKNQESIHSGDIEAVSVLHANKELR